MNLRDYQQEIVNTAIPILKKYKFLYLAMEVRTGKTLTSLSMSGLLPVQNLLFITKKKAIYSIQDDYNKLNPSFSITIINYESLHKIEKNNYDMIICDEAHSMGAYPKPSRRAKQVKELIKLNNPFVILLSGTPTPESYVQMYHQVYGIPNNPFHSFRNFYAFAKVHANIKLKYISSMPIKDYSHGLQSILDLMKPYTISWTQKEAGFKVTTDEEVLTVKMNKITYMIIEKLKKNLVVQGNDNTILADTSVKLMSKLHQLYSGTVKFEEGGSMVLDYKKAEFIYFTFRNKKIAIFYKFKEELNAIKSIYKDEICTEIQEFNTTTKSIALQIVSGREGISLKLASALVYYNIDFSATSYWQSRDRMTTKDRKYNKLYWIFSEKGIEHDIYKTVIKKKDYTLNHFKKDLLSL
tara:strand:- start:38918 stop:40147 length:1230 start_codon:yes stop_codon:yes gene_type:complete